MARPSIKFTNGEEGQNIFINFNIIFELYDILGNDVAPSCFNEGGRRRTKKTIYQVLQSVISKDQYKKLRNGENIEFTEKMRNNIIDFFELDERYFRQKNAGLIPVEGLDKDNWVRFIIDRQVGEEAEETEEDNKEKSDKKESDKVKIKRCLIKFLELDDKLKSEKMPVLYSIYYRFQKGFSLDAEKGMLELVNKLCITSYEDWEYIKHEKHLERAEKALQKQLEYVRFRRKYLEYIENKKNKKNL